MHSLRSRSRWLEVRLTAVVIVGAAALGAGCSEEDAAAAQATLPTVASITDCANLTNADVSGAVGAETRITSASVIRDDAPAPYCRVLGEVEPKVRFEVRLPVSGWTQRFVQTGCGGLCGQLGIHLDQAATCVPAQKGELALASSDMGHSGGPGAEWGARDYAARIDFAYRGMHVTALAAKALIETYYGRRPRYSYFAGCSDGGREALMEAQRYPRDFDGISAGAPAMNFTTQNTFYHGWNARTNTDASGRAILTGDKLPILHAAAVAQCDTADGLRDGLISDPLHCHVDLSAVQCRAGQRPDSCLSAAQVQVAREIYRGAHDSAGAQLVIGGPLPGSELGWAGVLVPEAGSDRLFGAGIALGTIKYLASDPNPPESFRLDDFGFDRQSFDATTGLHGLYDATDPDLSAFAAAGGKLLLWHGLADPHISPLNTVAYYAAMQRLMGAETVDRFARLFLFPGGSHCGGGEGPMDVDLLTALMGWVERGRAPNVLLASHATGERRPGAAAGPADRTRPVYAYPKVARYVGTGSIDSAASFVAGEPTARWPSAFDWLGASFYTAGYELWCSASGAHFDCRRSR